MYLHIDGTEQTAVLSDGRNSASYRRAGLSNKSPDARYSPGRTELEPHLRNANYFPEEFTVEFYHTNEVWQFIRI
jgi:hypothetical protein